MVFKVFRGTRAVVFKVPWVLRETFKALKVPREKASRVLRVRLGLGRRLRW
jgi:hypothetical protein